MRVRTAHNGQVELRRKSPYLRLDPGERHILAVYLEGVKAPQVPAAHLDGALALPGWVGGDDHPAGRPGRKDRSNRPSCSMSPISTMSTLSATVSSAPVRTLKPSPTEKWPPR